MRFLLYLATCLNCVAAVSFSGATSPGTEQYYFNRPTAYAADIKIPLTFSFWFKALESSSTIIAFSISNNVPLTYIAVGPQTNRLVISSYDTAETRLYSQNTFTTNEWHHGCAVLAQTNLWYLYLDGVRSTNTTSRNPIFASSSATRVFTVGALQVISGTNSVLSEYVGDVAFAAVWDTALTEDQVLMLSKGAAPTTIRPLPKWYWDFTDSAAVMNDLIGTTSLLKANAPIKSSTDPRIYK